MPFISIIIYRRSNHETLAIRIHDSANLKVLKFNFNFIVFSVGQLISHKLSIPIISCLKIAQVLATLPILLFSPLWMINMCLIYLFLIFPFQAFF